MAKNKRRASGQPSRSPSGAYSGGPVSSTISLQVPGGGVPWAFIAFLLASASLFAFGLYLVVLSGRMEVVFNTYLLDNWKELDCGVGPGTVGARKPSGLLRKEVIWVAPAFGSSWLLTYFVLAASYLLRRTSLSQWISGGFGLVSISVAVTLSFYKQIPACLVIFIFAVVCIFWQISWFDSRHFSRAVAFTISKTRLWTLVALSFFASSVTILSYAGFLTILYSLRHVWELMIPSCTKDRDLFSSRFMVVVFVVSIVTYWITHVVSSFAQTLGALATKNQLLHNVRRESGQSPMRRARARTGFKSIYNSVCCGAGLVSSLAFLKDFALSLGQNLTLLPESSSRFSTTACLVGLLTYLGPFYTAVDMKISDWTFSMIALDSTSYWQANKSGVALMSATGLDILKDSGLFQMIAYFPVAIGVISAISTFLFVTLMPHHLVKIDDLLEPEILLAFACFAGSQIARAAFAPFKGAMCTIFVMMARDPAVFQEHQGQIWTRLEELHPGIAETLLK
ncbi:putative bcpie2 protein [Botrytis fragariae]|uniref:Protein PNS1 n=1 Tax=Botrytis fragariae TaxID=1964551 RepID=A0A8H6AJY9_9HELO|nr:putative bcpie2 protein [Botrytis fragariae]KAF5868797.1 putative bcpie2 protein [Botrytis fragariae]